MNATADDSSLEVVHVGEAAWPRWQQIGFRYLLCHALLYAFPMPVAAWFHTLAQGLSCLANRLELPLLREGVFTWPRTVASALGGDPQGGASGMIEQAWQAITTWLHGSGLTPIAVVHQPTGSGDTGHEWVKLGCIVVLAAAITLAWSLLAKASRGYPRLGRWLHLYARWYLAFVLLSYGLHKVYGGQFGELDPMRLTQEVGDKSGMGMVWLFMAASRPYELFGAFGEVAAGLLLLHRRTALLGCLVAIVVMANVCALNWLYDVPVKLFSTHLLAFAVFLLAPYAGRLWALLVTNRPSAPVDLAVVHRAWLAWLLAIFGWSWAVAHLVETHVTSTREVAAREARQPRPALSGVWDVERMVWDGVESPAGDAASWRQFGIDRGFAFARGAGGQPTWFRYAEDLAAGTVSLTPAAGGEPATLRCERGRKIVKEQTVDPPTMERYMERVDVERATLVLRGTLGNRQLELHLVQRSHPLQRGFRFVQELPFHR